MTPTLHRGDCLKAPFPWFGGKSRAASIVWPRFGEARNYVEPFFGSGAMLLARPLPFAGTETVNDYDGFVANFWRALKADPEAVAHHADHPVNENDLHARHSWLVGERGSIQSRLEGDPDYFDAKVAGWWAWGIACWIGSGFCSGKGPWQVAEIDGYRQLVHLGDAGRGVNRQRVHLGNAGQGVNRQLVHLGNAGQGVNRQLVHLGDAGQGEGPTANGSNGLLRWLEALASRLRFVRVCCGDWERVCGSTPTVKLAKPTAVFLDPPYADTAKRDSDLYRVDSVSVAHRVRAWAIERGDDPAYRIALCGYEGEHSMPDSWTCVDGKATNGGYGSQAATNKMNHRKERIWFSPHCLSPSEDRGDDAARYPLLTGTE